MRKISLTAVLGSLILLASEFFLLVDVRLANRGALHSEAEIRAVLSIPPKGLIGETARYAAVNMTALAWIGYLLLMEGLLARTSVGSPGAAAASPLCIAVPGVDFYLVHL